MLVLDVMEPRHLAARALIGSLQTQLGSQQSLQRFVDLIALSTRYRWTAVFELHQVRVQ